MAASLLATLRISSVKNAFCANRSVINQTWTRTAFFKRRKEKETEVATIEPEDQQPVVPAVFAKPLKKRTGIQQVRPYSPPADVEARVQRITTDVCSNVADWKNYVFENNRVKFKILTQMMAEFDHSIPNADLTNMKSVSDALRFFSTPVRDTSALEDLSKLDLPPNLHIQMDHLRFDPETDTMFGGVSAFPNRPTIVTSLKYRRKYGNKQ
ncbi:hypothetical protein BaRGS_00028706 [Batillaria attramentaria]|uniref:Large ribosomal subunit protein mL50 n=1 Tax=Batillaria attramentaria TaxID=370345 RepID=A0ABD0JZ73_9CAEN